MKKTLFLLFLIVLLFTGCQSKQKKADKLIRDYMSNYLHDYKSYEPIETKIDSLYMSPYINEDILIAAIQMNRLYDECETHMKAGNSAIESMSIWQGNWSTYGNTKYKEAKQKAEEESLATDKALLGVARQMLDIKSIADTLSSDFYGWRLQHKFRANNGYGNPRLATFVFWTDKSFSEVLFTPFEGEDDIEEYNELLDCIDEAIEMERDSILLKINVLEKRIKQRE